MKSRLLILDANVIISAFKKDFWKVLVSQYEVHVTSIVLRKEAYFYEDNDGKRFPIDLEAELKAGKIKELTATADEVEDLVKKVNPNFMERIDEGEGEALALMLTGRYDDFRYCTGDARAIKALSSLSLGTLGISLEEVLTAVKQQAKLPDPSYEKSVFERRKAEGLQEQHTFLKKSKSTKN